jgi:hypothetical protein
VVLGRSEASLESYLARLEGKHLVVCLDLAVTIGLWCGNTFRRRGLLPIAFT